MKEELMLHSVMTLKEWDQIMILRVLQDTTGTLAEKAKLLGISYSTLKKKIREGINDGDPRFIPFAPREKVLDDNDMDNWDHLNTGRFC